jgi:hypothetical protein
VLRKVKEAGLKEALDQFDEYLGAVEEQIKPFDTQKFTMFRMARQTLVWLMEYAEGTLKEADDAGIELSTGEKPKKTKVVM